MISLMKIQIYSIYNGADPTETFWSSLKNTILFRFVLFLIIFTYILLEKNICDQHNFHKYLNYAFVDQN